MRESGMPSMLRRRSTTPAKVRLPTTNSAGNTTKNVESGTKRRDCPATTKPSGPAIDATPMTAVKTFARKASGVRTVSTPMSGAFTSGVQKPTAATTTIARRPRHREAEQEERQRHRDDRERSQLQQVHRAHEALRGERAAEAPAPKAAKR